MPEPRGEVFLYCKEDGNALWPGQLVELLVEHPPLIDALFADPAAVRTAHFLSAAQDWVRTLPPMEQFAMQQPFIEAVIEEFGAFRERLRRQATRDRSIGDAISRVLDAMRTRIFAQPLCPDTLLLQGSPEPVLENDQAWEAHLVEGVWISEQHGRYFCFHAANEFATDNYGVGVAVGDTPLGPFRKTGAAFLASCENWSGPGHPSVATGPDGAPLMFLHAYRPGTGGYKVFRALLALPIEFDGDEVRVAQR